MHTTCTLRQSAPARMRTRPRPALPTAPSPTVSRSPRSPSGMTCRATAPRTLPVARAARQGRRARLASAATARRPKTSASRGRSRRPGAASPASQSVSEGATGADIPSARGGGAAQGGRGGGAQRREVDAPGGSAAALAVGTGESPARLRAQQTHGPSALQGLRRR